MKDMNNQKGLDIWNREENPFLVYHQNLEIFY